MANDTINISATVQHLSVISTNMPLVNYQQPVFNYSATKCSGIRSVLVTNSSTPVTISLSDFTTVCALAVWNQDASFNTAVTFKPLGASTAQALPVQLGGCFIGTVNVDPTSNLVFSTTNVAGSTLYFYVAGT